MHLPVLLRSLVSRGGRGPVVGHLSAPLADEEIERLYRDQVLTPEFYGEGYSRDLAAAPRRASRDMAGAIVRHLAPRRTLDVGCGVGALVAEIRRAGVDGAGCDFSDAFLERAPRRARGHLTRQDVAALGYEDGAFDVVTCMEVLEHLPERVIDQAVAELRRVARGVVVVTTPSFGPNPHGPDGIPVTEPDWREDAAAGRRFRRIILDERGLPHCGHLTLATYAWWTERFLRHGLRRDPDLERAMMEGPPALRRWRWNLYALRAAT